MIALDTAALFGWTLEQVLGLTWPQFNEVTTRLESLRYRRALHEVFFGTAAAIDRETKENLFKSTPGLLCEATVKLTFTPEQLAIAEARANEYLKEKNVQRG